MEVVTRREAERFGAEHRQLMSERQVIKISLSGNWTLPCCTFARTLLLVDRHTKWCKSEKKGLTLFILPGNALTPLSSSSYCVISRRVLSLALSHFRTKMDRSYAVHQCKTLPRTNAVSCQLALVTCVAMVMVRLTRRSAFISKQNSFSGFPPWAWKNS